MECTIAVARRGQQRSFVRTFPFEGGVGAFTHGADAGVSAVDLRG